MTSPPLSLIESMLAQPAARAELIRRYARGELEDALLEAVEIRMLEDDQFLEECRGEVELRDAMKSTAPLEIVPIIARPPRRLPGMAFAAAAVVVALVPAFAWWTSTHPSGEVETSLESTTVLTLTGRRSAQPANDEQKIEIPVGIERFVLRAPAPNRPGPQRAEFWMAGARTYSLATDVVPDEEGWGNVLLRRHALAPGRYTLRWANTGGESDLQFELDVSSE